MKLFVERYITRNEEGSLDAAFFIVPIVGEKKESLKLLVVFQKKN